MCTTLNIIHGKGSHTELMTSHNNRYLADEPDGAGDVQGPPVGVPPEVVQAAYDLVKELDPERPVLLSLNCMHSAPFYQVDPPSLLGFPPRAVSAVTLFCGGLESRHLERKTQGFSRFLMCLQGGRAHPLAACAVATLCCPLWDAESSVS